MNYWRLRYQKEGSATMSDEVRHIRGIGNVITDPDAFDDSDTFGSDRLADRREVAAVDADDSDYAPPSKSPSRGWADKPSIVGQASKAPTTVRTGPLITTVLDLSIPSDLQALNDLQAKASALEGPFVEIYHTDKKFHEGKWHVLVNHSVISYQQL
jgi:hypothetical protein